MTKWTKVLQLLYYGCSSKYLSGSNHALWRMLPCSTALMLYIYIALLIYYYTTLIYYFFYLSAYLIHFCTVVISVYCWGVERGCCWNLYWVEGVLNQRCCNGLFTKGKQSIWVSNIRHKDFHPLSSVLLCHACATLLDSEKGWTWEL